jgi:hypothetical protein
MALRVPYGSDPYNPLWGSVIGAYLGTPQTTDSPALVSSEVSRVLAQLIAAQQSQLTQSALTGSQSALNAADVIASVDSVSAVQSPADPETIIVSVALTTQAGVQVTVSTTTGGTT